MKNRIILLVLLPMLLCAQVVDTMLKLPGRPLRMTYVPEGNKLYVKVRYIDSTSHHQAAWLYVLDCASRSFRQVYDLGENAGYDGGVWSRQRNRFYYGALADGGGDIAVIDNATDSLVKWIRPYDSFQPAYDSRDDKLYCTSLRNVAVVDCATDSVIKVINAPFQLWGFACWDSVNDQVFVGSAWEDKVVAIDCRTDSITAVIPTGAVDPAAAAIYSQRSKLYVSSDWTGLAVIDVKLLVLVNYMHCATSDGVWQLPATVNAVEDKVYLPVYGCYDSFPNYGDTLMVLRGEDDSIIKRLPTWGDIFGMALTPNGERVYVTTNHGDGTGNLLLIVDCRSDSVIGSCRFGTFSTDIAYNPFDQEMYVTDCNDSALYILRDTIPSGIAEQAHWPPGGFNFSVSPNLIGPGEPLHVTIEVGAVTLGQTAALRLFDRSGRLVAHQKVMLDQPKVVRSWTPSEIPLAAGVYFLRLEMPDRRESRKLVIE